MASNNHDCTHGSKNQGRSTPCEGCRVVSYAGGWATTPTHTATMQDIDNDLNINSGAGVVRENPLRTSVSRQIQPTGVRPYNPQVGWSSYRSSSATYNGSATPATDASHGRYTVNYAQFSRSRGYSTRAESVSGPARGQDVSLHGEALGRMPQTPHLPYDTQSAYTQSQGASPWNGYSNHTIGAAQDAINRANTLKPTEHDEHA